MKRTHRINTRQRGAVLLVSLLLLLVTTFIGFSSMETSNLESKMATSRELKEQTFQGAEAAIELSLEDGSLRGNAFNVNLQGGTNWPTDSYDFDHDTYMSGDVTVRFNGTSPGFGNSIKTDDSNTVQAHFEVDAVASRADSNISSRHVQGFYIQIPKL